MVTCRPGAVTGLLLLRRVAAGRPRSSDPVILALGERRRSAAAISTGTSRPWRPGAGRRSPPEVRRSLLDAFLEERILVLEARARGPCRRGRAAEAEQAAVQRLLRDEVLAKVRVGRRR